MLLRIALCLALIASPSTACEPQFRAGLAAFAALEGRLTDVETVLYSDLAWVSRNAVVARLEQRSALTTACQEVATLRATLEVAQGDLDRAAQSFRLATALCIGENRVRAQGNIDNLDDSARALTDLIGYLDRLRGLCGPGP